MVNVLKPIMYIVKVIPFAKSLRKESLSYFSNKDIPAGQIVSIELRKKIVQGLVISSTSGDKLKSEIRSSQFKLKKIKGISKNILIRKEFIKAANQTAKFFATTTGSVLTTFIPTKILDDIKKLKTPQNPNNNTSKESGGKYLIQDQYTERLSNYKSLIREEFAKRKSVIFVCPTLEDVLKAKELLSKGIEDNTFILNSTMTQNQIVKNWNGVISHEKPILLITTGVFLGIPRHDIGTIVIEKESSGLYRTQKMPYIDVRYLAEKYAVKINARFIMGDVMLRAETLWRYDQNEFYEHTSLKFRSLSSASQKIIDMKQDKNNGGEIFSIFSNEVKNLIQRTRESNGHTFFFAARRGLAPNIVCGDCGTIVKCHECEAPVVLHGKNPTEQGNYFKCHVCSAERHAGETCKNCGSWKLNTLGIGVETIEKELKENYPNNKVFTLDSDSAKTPKQAREIVDQFYANPGSILVGTEMAVLYLREPVENAAVITIDALFGIPDFAIRERILRILLNIRALAINTFYIQTRKIEDKIFEYARHGNLSEFYREEFRDRGQFKYPPFSNIIKISLAGTRANVIKEFTKLEEYFEPLNLISYQAFSPNSKGKFVMNGIIKLKRADWINEELREKIISLPPQYKVVIDSDNLL